jgi:hypothetical protein
MGSRLVVHPVREPLEAYQAIKELWVASDPAKGTTDWQGSKEWTTVRWWWGAFLVSGVLAWGSLQVMRETIAELISRDYGLIARDLAWVIAGILAIAVVREIDRRQSLISVGGAPKRPDIPAPPGNIG